jgi:hypothetical protein
MSNPNRTPLAIYSSIFSFRLANVSLLNLNSTTKSGAIGAKEACCSRGNAFQRSDKIQAASGERVAPFGKVNLELESKDSPVPLASDQTNN